MTTAGSTSATRTADKQGGKMIAYYLKGLAIGFCLCLATIGAIILILAIFNLVSEPPPDCDEALLLLGVAAASDADARPAAAMAYACIYPDAPPLPLPPEARPGRPVEARIYPQEGME